MKIMYEDTPKFSRDVKKLLKKLPTLLEDLETLKKNAIEIFHIHEIDNEAIFEIEGAGNNDYVKFYKIKKISCKSLKGKGVRSGIRVIYAYFPYDYKVFFIEIYRKSFKKNEDRDRINDFFKNIERKND